MANSGGQIYGFGHFHLDRQERVLLRDGQIVPLRPKDFDLLLVLVESHRRIVGKDELMARVWPETFVEEANLSHHVFTLRKALGDDQDGKTYIETIPRRGYRFVAEVAGLAGQADPQAGADAARSSTPPDDPRPEPLPRVGRSHTTLISTAIIVAMIAAGYAGWLLKPSPSRPITRLAITLPQGDRFTVYQAIATSVQLVLSPDGMRVAYATNGRLYLRPLDRLEATPLAGIERPGLASARVPFFSPDGEWIGFWEQRHLKKVSIHGGAPVVLCELGPPPYGATWASDNTILIGSGTRGVLRVSADGGTPEQVVTVEKGQRAYGPQLLPDGRSVLFTLAHGANWDDAQVVVQSLDTGARRTVIGGADARYLPTGHLVYALRDTVLGVRFDATSASIKGTPVPLIEGVRRQGGVFGSAVEFTVSADGTLAYLEAKNVPLARRTLVWVDRQGREESLPIEPRGYVFPRISPDGGRLALDIDDDNRDIWVWDFSRRHLTRVTADPALDVQPVWTADGQRLIFNSLRTGIGNVYWQSADGAGQAEQLTTGPRIGGADAMTPDGKGLVLRESDGEGGFDLTLVQLNDGARPVSAGTRTLVRSAFAEANAEISPDGRWLAYQSTDTGAAEIYLRPFPETEGRQWRISTGGGKEPLWSRDSKELFFRGPNGAVMRVAITAQPPTPMGTPTQLFEGSSYALSGRGEWVGRARRTYDVSSDGHRFVMIKSANAAPTTPTPERIVVVQNWFEEMRAKLRPN